MARRAHAPRGAAAPATLAASLVLLLVALVVGATATPAGAHANLESTEPANGETVPEPPDSIVLHFSEGVEMTGDGPTIYDADQTAIATGPVQLADAGREVRVAVPVLADGSYVVTFRAISGDGHPVSGSFTFAVGSPSEVPLDPATLDGGPAVDDTVDYLAALGRAVAFGAALLAIGALLLAGSLLGDAAVRLRRLVVGALGVLVLASVGQVLLAGPYVRGTTIGDAFDALGDGLDADAGRAAALRGVLALLGVVLVAGLARAPRLRPAIGLWSVLVVSTFSSVGHTRTGRWQNLAVATDVLHVLAAAWWIGGLVALLVLLARDVPVTAVRRYSSITAGAVAVVVATGVLQSVRQVEDLGGALDTTYGRVLLVKVVAVLAIVGLGGLSRRVTQRRLDDADGPGMLRRIVAIETVIAIVVVSLTAVLVNEEPPRAADAAPEVSTEPVRGTAQGGGLTFAIELTPGRTGANEVTVEVQDAAGDPVELFELSGELHPVDESIAPLPITFTGAAGRYVALDVAVPFSGDYTLSLAALTGPIDQIDTETEITIP